MKFESERTNGKTKKERGCKEKKFVLVKLARAKPGIYK